MTSGEALLANILASPDDDAPRLIYADWLDEHGEPERAELIRVQCEMERLPERDARRGPLAERAYGLARAHAGRWLGPLRQYYHSTQILFRRGLPVVLRMTPGQFLTRAFQQGAAEWISRAGVQEMRLDGKTARVGKLLECPQLAHIHTLTWRECHLGDAGFRDLAGCPHLVHLRRLHLEKPYCGLVGLRYLAGSPNLARLVSLNLESINSGPHAWFRGLGAGVRILLEGSRLSGLEELALPDAAMDYGGRDHVRELVEVAGLARLRGLDLSGNLLQRRAARYLAVCPHLGGLKRLELRYNQIDDLGVNALLDSPHLRGLEYLGLDHQHPFTYDRTFLPIGDATRRHYRERFGREIE